MTRIALSAAIGVFLLIGVAVPQGYVMLAGGKDLTARDATFLSPKNIGAGNGEVAEEVYQFHFTSPFPITKVLVRMEDWQGERIPTGAKNAITGMKVRRPESQEKEGEPAEYTVLVRARTDRNALRFALAFVGSEGLVPLDELSTPGGVVVARPVPAGAEGLLLPVTNTDGDKLCFFRGEFLGALPRIKSVEVSDTAETFHVETTPDRRSFVLRGGALAAGKHMEVRIHFAAAGTERGALLLSAAYN